MSKLDLFVTNGPINTFKISALLCNTVVGYRLFNHLINTLHQIETVVYDEISRFPVEITNNFRKKHDNHYESNPVNNERQVKRFNYT